MNLTMLNKVCFGIAVASIVAGVALGLVMVWTPGVDETLWKLVATVGIVFLGSFATLSVSRTYGQPGSGAGERGSSMD
jgi:fluoride ion exporter CrcB/FEX